jgi:hypothetical protein
VDTKLINARGIYKDTFGSSIRWADYQCRPNMVRGVLWLFDPRDAPVRSVSRGVVTTAHRLVFTALVQAVTMAVAPDLFVTEHARTALDNFEVHLLGRDLLGR